MRLRSAEMFNKRASHPKNKPKIIVNSLKIEPEMKIVDLGAGGGYFSFKFAEKVRHSGVVYALDTDEESLKYIGEEAKKRGLDNIKTIKVSENELKVPEKVDLIFLRKVYHHLENRMDYFKKVRHKLKKHGKLAIIEHNKEGFGFHKIFGHYVEKETIIKEIKAAGYKIKQNYKFLPMYSFLVFEK